MRLKLSNLFRFACLLLLLGTITLVSRAQRPEPKFTSITSMDGLSSNTVSAILKDRYGLMWFATDDGLNRFDGTDMIVYRHKKKDSTSLRSSDISSLHQDKSGRIWVGTNEGGLHFYHRNKDRFVSLPSPHSITSITSDTSGKLWVATTAGLIRVDQKSLHISTFSSVPSIPDEISKGLVLSVAIDRKQRVWVGTRNGLYRIDPSHKNNEYINFLESLPDEAGLRTVKSIIEDLEGNIWVGTYSGVFKLDQEGKIIRNFRYESGNKNSLSTNMVFALALENDNKMWICTDAGLNILNMRDGNITRYGPDARTQFSLNNKSVRSILIDNEGIFWLGTYKGGVNKYDHNLAIFGLKRSDVNDPYGLSEPFVTSFAETGSGELFVGTDGGGLNLYNRETNLFRKFPINPKNKNAASGLAILTLKLTAENELWIGTFQDGLFRFNPKTGAYTQYTRGKDTTSLNNNEIFCLAKDRSGRLWVGTNGGGVHLFNPVTDRFERYHNQATPISKRMIPLNGYIRDIVQDSRGMLWIASHGTGIAVFDPSKKSSVLLDKQSSNLPSNIVSSILQDKKGNIWVGTFGEGMALYDQKTKKFISFGEKEGLASNIVNKILEDAQGRIWLSTNQGISCFDVKSRKFTNYTTYNGIQDKTFVLGAGIRATDNTLFFGGIAGFNYIDTRSLPSAKSIAPVILKDLRIGNRSITPADSNFIDADISVAKTISLDYKQNFSVGFAALDYTNPRQVHYRHRLVGMHTDWNETGLANSASYTNLSPGKYVFEVQASGDGINWGPQTTSVQVVVKPPFYLTIYAYILYILTPFAIVFYMRRRGIQKLQRQFKEQQQRAEEKQAKELDNLKIKFLTNLSHEFRTPISLILAPVENLLVKTQKTELNPPVVAIKRNAKRLLNLVDQLLDFKNMQQQELTLDLNRKDIISFIRETCEQFTDLSIRKGIQFKIESDIRQLMMDFDSEKLERILFNLLSNAFKFTPKGGTVKLEIFEHSNSDGNGLSIAVADNGIGIPEDKHDKIFERFFQNDTDLTVLNQGSGIGLSIVREFVQLHKGNISVASHPGVGSTFTVQLPVASDCISVPMAEPQLSDEKRANAGMETRVMSQEKSELEEPSIVLIIEDNEEFRQYLKESLMPYYHVIEAVNGKEGWQKTLSHHPELIVSDIAMPEMDGITLSQKIKGDKRTKHIPIILLTASTGEQQQLEGLNSGANDYLTKPFNFDILNAKINNLILLNRLLKGVYSRHIKVSGQDPQIESSQEKLLKDMLSYIEDNLHTSQLSVENLSKHVGMSRGTLYSKVLEMSGQTPIEFIRSIKLEKAAVLLENSDLSISQISYMTGFTAPNYFAKSFKAKFNMLPTEYKARKRKQLQ
ncbi:hybrid sensor histidine kinase/response regulator transcription factor [Dyadobacter sp. CY312]|uniref:hybrid sensor histidine kinase/response regulator transcription factor n=1 Tax=Dyadobacter sp. CY312 TaxID=2907303 RepID=UPI001F19B4F2|nr:hybrid sensor histidine kinase/response regulator transcription factor [Dyadobacter sp. CY312]MCE7041665.1 ATP-binding protein [Dyadobacter sp. CY312]